MEYAIIGARRQGKAALWQMLGIGEQIRGLPWWRNIEVRLRGWRAPWNPKQRPQPATALLEVASDLAYVNANPRLPMDERARLEIETDAWLCLSTMLAGHGNEETWGVIVKNLNVALLLTELGYAEEYLPAVMEAMAGAFRARLRHDKTGKWGFDGQAAAAIREALGIHQVQLQVATKADVAEALRLMHERLDAGEVYASADAES